MDGGGNNQVPNTVCNVNQVGVPLVPEILGSLVKKNEDLGLCPQPTELDSLKKKTQG